MSGQISATAKAGTARPRRAGPPQGQSPARGAPDAVPRKRRRKTVYGQSENEVLQKLSKLRTARDRGIDLLAPSWTMGQWLDAWLSDIKKFDGTRPATLTLYKGLAERYVKPVLGGVRLDKLTPAHVQSLVTETRATLTSRGTPPSATTVQRARRDSNPQPSDP